MHLRTRLQWVSNGSYNPPHGLTLFQIQIYSAAVCCLQFQRKARHLGFSHSPSLIATVLRPPSREMPRAPQRCVIPFDAVILSLNARRAPLQPGADIQFHRPNRLDVCLVQNHHIALYVPSANAYRKLLLLWLPYLYTKLKIMITASSSRRPIYLPSSARVTSIWA